jgi:DNA-binding LytR/AlgR family response regulator
MRILIVEDDPIIGADLEDRLQELGYETLGPISTGEEAVAFFDQNLAPDLVLMDIQLGGQLDGIETVRLIQQKHTSTFIFLTSNSDDATFTRAKSVKPSAFLSKPFRGRDLKHAIELALGQVSQSNTGQGNESPENTYLLQDRLFIKVNERMIRLFLQDILWVEADDYYCKIVTKEREYLLSQTLKKFSESISSVQNFMRIHRSYIVNIAQIEEIGDLYVFLHQKKIPVSKTAKEELLAQIQKI